MLAGKIEWPGLEQVFKIGKYDLRGITLSQMRRTRRCADYKADGTPCRQWAMHHDALQRCVAHRNGEAEFERIMRVKRIPCRVWGIFKFYYKSTPRLTIELQYPSLSSLNNLHSFNVPL